jgi:hypothetical protein
MMDQITQAHCEEEKVEQLCELIEIEDENEEDQDEGIPATQLYACMLSDKEKRKMEKVQAQTEKDAEKARKIVERETLKAKRKKEKADEMRAIIESSRPLEIPSSAQE